jgi:altronate dehydratase
VATAVRALAAGVTVRAGGTAVRLRRPIPAGHKFALAALSRGDRVIKYGETIGVASRRVRQGDHVHVHNLAGTRGRGDLRRRRRARV